MPFPALRQARPHSRTAAECSPRSAPGAAAQPRTPCQGQWVSRCVLCLAEKPGTCPSVKPGIPMLGLCVNQCKMDSNCSGSLKCCRNGCGKVSCVTPLH